MHLHYIYVYFFHFCGIFYSVTVDLWLSHYLLTRISTRYRNSSSMENRNGREMFCFFWRLKLRSTRDQCTNIIVKTPAHSCYLCHTDCILNLTNEHLQFNLQFLHLQFFLVIVFINYVSHCSYKLPFPWPGRHTKEPKIPAERPASLTGYGILNGTFN